MNIEKEERANAKRIEQFTKDKDCLLLLSNKSHPSLSAWSYTDEESYYPFVNEKYFFGKEVFVNPVPYSPIESCHMMDSESNLQTDFDDQFVLRDKLELLTRLPSCRANRLKQKNVFYLKVQNFEMFFSHY